jgi:hypothetical protein
MRDSIRLLAAVRREARQFAECNRKLNRRFDRIDGSSDGAGGSLAAVEHVPGETRRLIDQVQRNLPGISTQSLITVLDEEEAKGRPVTRRRA